MVQRLDFLEKVRPFVGLDVIKVLTGMRTGSGIHS